MAVRKILAPVLAALLFGAVGAGIWYSHDALVAPRAALPAAATPGAALRGLIGSEKAAFFADARVQAALARHGLRVTVEKAGSRTIAMQYDPGAPQRYDFGFPSGAPAAALLRERAGTTRDYTPFYTPIVIASWRPIADLLAANGVAQLQADGTWSLDLKALLALSAEGRRWRDLKDNAAFPSARAVLVGTTDVRSSNSAAMFLALASWLANGEQVVQDEAQAARVLAQVAPLFLRQGFQEASSADPFQDYAALGMGKAPLLAIYESQFVEYRLRHPQPAGGSGDMVMLYPHPTIYSKHVLVPFTPAGARLGELLDTDPELRALMHDYGFRTGGDRHGPEGWRAHGLAVPEVLVDLVEPPAQVWLERLIHGIETAAP